LGGVTTALLAGAIVLLVVSTRRAQLTAQAQLQYVAGVSHELKTPLSAIRSAGYNLSKGLVTDGERVKEYGEIIRTEARRLSEIVGHAMRYAALQSGDNTNVREPMNLRLIVEAAMTEAGLGVATEIDPQLPQIRGDSAAIQHCIQNLLSNAAKYAEPVRICVRPHGAEVLVTVEDR